MAVSKRTRYEVLRRDGYTCQYCRATDQPLTVDHVVPVALGGSDDPSNLVAACRDCNAGKASASPDAALVAQVDEDALRWMRAIGFAIDRRVEAEGERDQLTDYFENEWNDRYEGPAALLPGDWRVTIWGYYIRGLRVSDFDDGIDIAYSRRLSNDDRWAYFCGVMRNKLRDLEDEARRAIDEGMV